MTRGLHLAYARQGAAADALSAVARGHGGDVSARPQERVQ